MKIYVITKGEYSAYHICAATTDKDRAEMLKRMASTDDLYGEARVEEVDDYFGLDVLPGKVYQVELGYKDGAQTFFDVGDAYYVGLDELDRYRLYSRQDGIHGRIDKRVWSDGEIMYTAYVVAPNEGKAEKIGIDMIQEYRAKEMGLSV